MVAGPDTQSCPCRPALDFSSQYVLDERVDRAALGRGALFELGEELLIDSSDELTHLPMLSLS
jgi:hypothetical protein